MAKYFTDEYRVSPYSNCFQWLKTEIYNFLVVKYKQ